MIILPGRTAFLGLAGYWPLALAKNFDGPELNSNGDFSDGIAGSPPPGWNVAAGTGVKVDAGGNPGAWFRQSLGYSTKANVVESSRRYRISASMRGDGASGRARLYFGNAQSLLYGPSAATWTELSTILNNNVASANNRWLYLFCNGAAGSECGIDNLTVKEVKPSVYSQPGIAAPDAHLYDVDAIYCYATDARGRTDGALCFDGADTYVGIDDDPVSDDSVTVGAWINAATLGETSEGTILGNGQFRFHLAAGSTAAKLALTSDGGGTTVYSADDSIPLAGWRYVSVKRAADGKATFFIGDTTNAPVQSGTADQDSGTPSSAPTSAAIGNNPAGGVAFDGSIHDVSVHKRLLMHDLRIVWADGLRSYV